MRPGKIVPVYILLILTGGLLILDQLWTQYLSQSVFWKIEASLCVILIVLFLADIIIKERTEDEQLKKDKFID